MSLTRAAAAADARKAMDKKVVALFRKMCREAPNVRVSYIIDESPALIRKMVGLAFRRNANVTDPRIVSMLLAKGEMELEETRNQWKQRGHLMALIKPDLEPADPVVDIEEHMRRLLDGSLTFEALTKDYHKQDMAKAARQVETAMAQGTYKAPKRIPGNSVGSAELPWAQQAEAPQLR